MKDKDPLERATWLLDLLTLLQKHGVAPSDAEVSDLNTLEGKALVAFAEEIYNLGVQELDELRGQLAASQAREEKLLEKLHVMANKSWNRGNFEVSQELDLIVSTYVKNNADLRNAIKTAVDKESDRLGAIIENHVDDMTWVLNKLGQLPGKMWKSSSCRIDRDKVEVAIKEIIAYEKRAALLKAANIFANMIVVMDPVRVLNRMADEIKP